MNLQNYHAELDRVVNGKVTGTVESFQVLASRLASQIENALWSEDTKATAACMAFDFRTIAEVMARVEGDDRTTLQATYVEHASRIATTK